MLAAAAVSLVGVVICVVWAPETRGLALHESVALTTPAEPAHPVRSHF
jgi:MFS transporter, putative metabolite transport protein